MTPQTVAVAAVHASLECAGHHVMVGHFKGTTLEGDEGFLDQRLGGRLSARQLLGQYPDHVGDAIVVDAPRPARPGEAGYPPGAVVVGLGLPGELTRDRLMAAVQAGLLCYAVRVMDDRESGGRAAEPVRLLEVAAVPIGTTGVGAISMQSCVAAMVDGVLLANEALFAQGDTGTGHRAWDQVRVARLDLVEVTGDKAERMAHAVRQARDLAQVDPGEHSRLELADCLLARQGGLPAALSGSEQAGDWQRVVVRNLRREQQAAAGAPPPDEAVTVLEFTAIGRRSRADAMQVPLDRRAVERLVEGAVRDARPDRQVGNTLYELLLPNDLKGDLARSDNLQLVVDENTADLPWEALTARFGGSRARQLALRGGLLRQFRETEGARAPARGPVGQRALVIGNPPPPPGLRSLPGASREAAAVAEALRSRFDVSALVWGPGGEPLMDDFPDISGSTGSRILDALFSQDWRIVHIAAHGRFEPSDPSASGVVLDDGIHLTANVVRQLAAVPELVFLNCCHLGRVAGDGGPERVAADRHRLAAGVSRQLMGIGVHAVVAAGWAVEDDAAVVFAEAVYERLLAGAFFGAAVQAARTTVHRRFEASSTWAAFQCYGDPGFRLFGAGPPEPAVPVVVSAGELVRRVRSIGVLAGKIGLPDFEELSARGRRLVAELDAHRRAAGDRGWATPAVLYRLGEAYGELGAYEQAVACYRQAWDHPDAASAPLRLLEQLGNFEVRLAQERRRAGGRPPGDGVAGLVEAAEGHLLLAHGLGATPERAALLASFHKKAGTLAAGEERRRHTAAAARRYREAVDLGAGRRAPAAYHVLNWLQLAALAASPVAPREAAAALDGVAAGQGAEAGPEDFWSRVGRADAALTRYVLGLVTGPGELEAGYRSAFATRSSRRDRDSVVGHLLDVAELGGDAALAALARALDPPP